MTAASTTAARDAAPLPRSEIEARVCRCPVLPSLRVLDNALRELVDADNFCTDRIAEIIGRDPSLTTRLMRLANSAVCGLTDEVGKLDEAVLYIGLRSVRQLAAATPVIEDMKRLVGTGPFPWRGFWQHCISTAMVAREIASTFAVSNEDMVHVAGLIHDVGKIVLALTMPRHFETIYLSNTPGVTNLCVPEHHMMGVDHGELGALYLAEHRLPDVLIDVARWHHEPASAGPESRALVAIVHLADVLVRSRGIGYAGPTEPPSPDAWRESPAWECIPAVSESVRTFFHQRMELSLRHVPTVVAALV